MPHKYRRGQILGYNIGISDQRHGMPMTETMYEVLDEDRVSSTVKLPCTNNYDVSISAFTVKGPSEPSSIHIPSHSLGKLWDC